VSSRSDFVRSVMTKRATYFPLPGCIAGPLYNEVDFAKRAAADELKCRFAWCSMDCMCATCSYHREGRKTVVGGCFCSRCMSMWPQLNTGKKIAGAVVFLLALKICALSDCQRAHICRMIRMRVSTGNRWDIILLAQTRVTLLLQPG